MMELKRNLRTTLAWCCLASCGSMYAATMGNHALVVPAKGPNHFEMIGAGGIASLGAHNSRLGVTSSETDTLVPRHNDEWDAFEGQLGIGYVYYLGNAQQYSDHVQWFPSFEPELNAYYISKSSITGDVWRFGSPDFNDLTYKMPIESARLMLDGALTIVSKKQYSLYAIGGIGNAWNRVGYRDSARDGLPCTEQNVSLNSRTRSNLAWEAGAGLSYAFNHRVAVSLEYLYTDLGTARTSGRGNTGTITAPVIVPAHFDLTSQAALLGLHIAL